MDLRGILGHLGEDIFSIVFEYLTLDINKIAQGGEIFQLYEKKHLQKIDTPIINGMRRIKFTLDGRPHRSDGPAVIHYKYGRIVVWMWKQNGKYHRLDGPAKVRYGDNYQLFLTEWYCNDELHCSDGPARMQYDRNGILATEQYYRNGQLHRCDGPAEIEYHRNSNQPKLLSWFENGVYHRQDEPACIWYSTDGSIYCQAWFIHGVRHRYEGPE